MFYLYIDGILISDYRYFSELRDFVFDFYLEYVDNKPIHVERLFYAIDQKINLIINDLINQKRSRLKYKDHWIEVFYER